MAKLFAFASSDITKEALLLAAGDLLLAVSSDRDGLDRLRDRDRDLVLFCRLCWLVLPGSCRRLSTLRRPRGDGERRL